MRRPLSLSSPSAGWTSAILLGRLVLVLVLVVVIVGPLFREELEQDAAGVLGVNIRLRPTVAALYTTERLDAEVADRLCRLIDVFHLEGDMVKAGAAVAQEAGQKAVVVQGLQDLDLATAGDFEADASIAGLVVLEATRHAHPHEPRQQWQRVVDPPDGPADVVQPLDSDLLVCAQGVLDFHA